MLKSFAVIAGAKIRPFFTFQSVLLAFSLRLGDISFNALEMFGLRKEVFLAFFLGLRGFAI